MSSRYKNNHFLGLGRFGNSGSHIYVKLLELCYELALLKYCVTTDILTIPHSIIIIQEINIIFTKSSDVNYGNWLSKMSLSGNLRVNLFIVRAWQLFASIVFEKQYIV